MSLNIDRILELMHYDSTCGKFYWKFTLGRMVARKEAGCLTKLGYRTLNIDKKKILAHRLVWFIEKGVFPTMELDHIDRNRDNNFIGNLREVSRSQNLRNTGVSRNNNLGLKGVHKHQSGYRAIIMCNRTRVDLGMFDTAKEAAIAFAAAEKVCINVFGEVGKSSS